MKFFIVKQKKFHPLLDIVGVNGRRESSKSSVFPFLPFMGKGARRADRGDKIN